VSAALVHFLDNSGVDKISADKNGDRSLSNHTKRFTTSCNLNLFSQFRMSQYNSLNIPSWSIFQMGADSCVRIKCLSLWISFADVKVYKKFWKASTNETVPEARVSIIRLSSLVTWFWMFRWFQIRLVDVLQL